MVIGLFPLRGCGRFVNSSWIGLDDYPVDTPVSVLLAAVYSGGSGSRNTATGPVGLMRGITTRPEPDQVVSDYFRRIPFRRHRYESMPRDWPLVFGHPLI